MNNYCTKILKQLEDEISLLSIEQDNSVSFFESVIALILDKLSETKTFVSERGFRNEEEEIHFFKTLKPSIISKLIYYNSIYKIEMKKPYGGEKIIRKYLNAELSRIKKYFDNNLDFYKYYRTNSNYLDHKYFVRGRHDIKLSLDTYYFESDHSFSTSHDYKVAKILANDLIQVYLEDSLLKTSQRSKPAHSSALTWTGSKTALIELIYSLYFEKVIDQGNVDIKVIAKYFESFFNVDLGDFYRTYLELRNRKINRTKFLDTLKDTLISKMEQQDEK